MGQFPFSSMIQCQSQHKLVVILPPLSQETMEYCLPWLQPLSDVTHSIKELSSIFSSVNIHIASSVCHIMCIAQLSSRCESALVLDSLVTKHLRRHLYVTKITKIKSQQTWHACTCPPSGNGLIHALNKEFKFLLYTSHLCRLWSDDFVFLSSFAFDISLT